MSNPSHPFMQLFIQKRPVAVALACAALVLAVCLVIWLNLSWRPDRSPLPADSGFYAYFGKAILHGQLPYRDVWDDKPPFGYYLNALALLIFGQTPWGIWWFSVLWIFGCTLLLFLIVKKLWGNVTAWVASTIFLVALMNPEIFQGGNLMEVYSLAPQIGVVGTAYWFFTHARKTRYAVLAGVLTACAYLIKQPTIVLGCSSILAMTISSLAEWKVCQAFKTALGFLAGLVGLVVAVSVYWLWHGALRQLADGIFLQGFSFVGGAQGSFREYFFYTLVNVIPKLYLGKLYLIAVLSGGLFLLGKLYHVWVKPVWEERLAWFEWFLVLAIFSFPLVAHRLWPRAYLGKFWVMAVFAFGLFLLVKFYRLRSRPVIRQVFSPTEWVWLIAVIALPLEVFMASLGGKYFGHYFMILLPAIVFSIAYPVWKVASSSSGALLRNALYILLAVGALAWGVGSFVRVWPSAAARENLAGIFRGHVPLSELEQYIVQTTRPDDEVLVWHIHVGINFITDRRAPSRFLFPHNLFIPPTEQNTKLAEYVADLESRPPELILVQMGSSMPLPFVDRPVDEACKVYCVPEFVQALKIPRIRQEWLELQQFVETHYVRDKTIYDWIVYRKFP